MKFARVGVAIAAAAIVVSACGSSSATTAPAATAAPDATAAPAATDAMTPVEDPLGVVEIPAGEPLHIAFWGVLSGADSSLGEDSKQGVEIAIDDIGGTIKGHDIRLTTEDALCTPDGGATAGQKLAADSTIVGLVGSSCSDEAVGGIASITAAGLTTISPSNTRPALTDPNRDATYAGYLRTAHSDAFQGKAAAEFVYNELKLTKAATIHDGSTYAEALQGVFVEEFQKLGGTITAQEAVTKETTDMSAVLKTVAASGPEVIYFPVFVAAAGFLSAQIPTVSGLENVKTMGADGHFSPDYLKAAGNAAVDHYLSSPNFGAFGAGYADLLTKRADKFGGTPLSVFHAHAYDATNMLFAALEKVAVENADGSLSVPKGALRDAIYATKDFPGITGTLTCTEFGDCGAPVIGVYQITQENVDTLTMPA
ncbi:MAG: branched-chain amino acid ABC transporter substrate-binding protein, partial [Chloroflexi bacterium]|nr:branched-chain amino acid ABC transporter substrate-binding protein [Chloroflexota bacterium]